MREPISRDTASPRELAEATRRLDRALARLDAACVAVAGRPAAASADDALGALERDRARLAAELEAARARGSELESAAAAASQALGRAAAEVRAALEDGEPVNSEISDPDLADRDLGGGDLGDGETIEGEAEAASKSAGDGLNEEAA
jgi:chromosome segregation ATPase